VSELLDDSFKGIPGGTPPFPIERIGAKGWNLLRGELPLPVLVLKESALDHNRRYMRSFVAKSGALFAPHGKTTMSPALFRKQLEDGAVAITLASVAQVQLARRHGLSRILLANQVVSRPALRYLFEQLRSDPGLELTLFADSLEGVALLVEAARAVGARRPLGILLECGFPGGRAGCRTLETAVGVARSVCDAGPLLALRGVAGFEGIVKGATDAESEARVVAFLDSIVATAEAVDREGLFGEGPIVLSAGGSAFYDLVVERFARARLSHQTQVVLRSGCYLTQDDALYARAFDRIHARSSLVRELGEGPRPALEVWAHLLSRPEPARAVATLGKRDASHDGALPKPRFWFRPGLHAAPQPLHDVHTAALNDQHALLELGAGSPLAVGDLLGFGISHPCLTFDRWPLVMLVNDAYDVVAAVRTYF
jgi:D-serine dehydratase